MTHAEYAELGGVEGAEIIMWLVLRGAMAPRIRCLHRSYYLPSMTAIATAIYEDVADERPRPKRRPCPTAPASSSPASSGSRAAIRSRSSAASAPTG